MPDHELSREEELQINFAAQKAHAEELLAMGVHPFEVADRLLGFNQGIDEGSHLEHTEQKIALFEHLDERIAYLVYERGFTAKEARKILYLSLILHSAPQET